MIHHNYANNGKVKNRIFVSRNRESFLSSYRTSVPINRNDFSYLRLSGKLLKDKRFLRGTIKIRRVIA